MISDLSDLKDARRRAFLRTSAAAGAGLALDVTGIDAYAKAEGEQGDNKKSHEKEVTATEDLMREHGVLRRGLLIYSEFAQRLRAKPQGLSADALHNTAKLFRVFGEDYHERAIEESYVFPEVKLKNDKLARYVDTLLKQHLRGREITDFILDQTQQGKLGNKVAKPLANALDSMVLMYQEHTAREDTVVFVAWKKMLSAHEYSERNEKFESIEHKMFGTDGFDEAVKKISAIEQHLGLADLAQFTAPPPPHRPLSESM